MRQPLGGKTIGKEDKLKIKLESFILIAILLQILISCSFQESQISTYVYETYSNWTQVPSYTQNPTYTNLPQAITEITKIVFITGTFTNTPKHFPTNTPTIANTPTPIEGTGTLIAIPNQNPITMSFFDLDTGINLNDSSSDIEFYVSCGSMCFPEVLVINKAKYFIYGRRIPSYEDCKNNMVSQSEFIIDKYICIQTNSGNISIIKVNWSDMSHENNWTVTFYYKTWKNRGK
jgi:hypothetical protein